MENKLDIVTLGEGLVEFSSRQSLAYADTLDKYYGGDTLTTAVAAARMGSNVGYVSKVANDAFKDFLVGSWAAEGLDVSQIKMINGHNGVYFVAGHDTGKKEFVYYRKKTAASMLSARDIDEDYIKSAKIVYATGITQSISISAQEAVLKMFQTAKENNVTVAFDPKFDPLLWSKEEAKDGFSQIEDYIDILFLNLKFDSFALWDIESVDKLIELFLDRGIKTVVLKSKHKSGYYVANASETLFVPFYSDIKVDSTGAGDAFNGAFLHSVAEGKSIFESAKFAAVVSGLQVRGVGAIKSIPSLKEVSEAMREQNG